ncbi:MAG TPA: hypothetical protein VE631_02440 [Alphaproteobacteria bacterium]|jgi:hypothetical protein|nr:hypothetical protein [Alphaproteobacteria bacterium]
MTTYGHRKRRAARGAVAALLAAGMLTAALPARADEAGRDRELERRAQELAKNAEKLARDTAERLVGTLNMLVGKIPQYEAPEILDNGDIIIRRKHPEVPPQQAEPDPLKPEETHA